MGGGNAVLYNMQDIELVPIRLRLSNAYLLLSGEAAVLVDTGSPGEEAAIEDALLARNLSISDLRLIVHTHGHSDHVGSTAALVKQYRCTTALHSADEEMVLKGKNAPLQPTRLMGKLLIPFVDKPFSPFTPDVKLEGLHGLEEFGMPVRLMPLPGHTSGSMALLLPGGKAIVGDVLMGGFMGGNFLPHLPDYHYYADDLQAVHRSLKALLDAGVHTWYPGHGGPVTTKAVLKRFSKVIA